MIEQPSPHESDGPPPVSPRKKKWKLWKKRPVLQQTLVVLAVLLGGLASLLLLLGLALYVVCMRGNW